MNQWLAAANLALASYNTGSMWTLQLMHYPLYASVGAAEFQGYVTSNNRRAGLPAIVPGVSLTILSIVVAVAASREERGAAIVEVAATLCVMASTGRWQARLHSALARDGYSTDRIALLVKTNWIRTVLYTLVSGLALYLLSIGGRHGN